MRDRRKERKLEEDEERKAKNLPIKEKITKSRSPTAKWKSTMKKLSYEQAVLQPKIFDSNLPVVGEKNSSSSKYSKTPQMNLSLIPFRSCETVARAKSSTFQESSKEQGGEHSSVSLSPDPPASSQTESSSLPNSTKHQANFSLTVLASYPPVAAVKGSSLWEPQATKPPILLVSDPPTATTTMNNSISNEISGKRQANLLPTYFASYTPAAGMSSYLEREVLPF